MWVAKLKIKHNCIIGKRCKQFNISTSGLPFNIYVSERGTSYVPQIQTLYGKKSDIEKFIDDLRKDKRVKELHRDKNNIFLIEIRREKIPSTFYRDEIFFLKPVKVDTGGYEYWQVCSLKKETLSKFISQIKKGIKNINIEISMLNKKKVRSIYFSYYLSSRISSIEKPRISDFEKGFWKLWHWLYPVYKKIYPSMNRSFYSKNIQNYCRKVKGEKRIFICGAADYDTIKVVHESLKEIGQEKNAKITLIDISSHALNISREFSRKEGIKAEFVKADILKLPKTLLKQKYDIVLTDGFLDYFNRKEKLEVLGAWAKLLKTNGIVITTIPVNYQKRFHFFDQVSDYLEIIRKAEKKKLPLKKVLLYEYSLNKLRELLRRKTGKHTGFSAVKELKEYCDKVGFEAKIGKVFYIYKSLGWKWRNVILVRR